MNMNASASILYSNGRNDECYTPRYAVEALLPYLKKPLVYWLPFDTKESEFCKVLNDHGYQYTNSHISEGKDFYEYEPEYWDCIISNPPFTRKRQIFERALSFGKPFALLMSLTWLNDAAPKQLWEDRDLQLLMFDKRIKFKGMGNKITFSSGYYCSEFLPKQIVMGDLRLASTAAQGCSDKNGRLFAVGCMRLLYYVLIRG